LHEGSATVVNSFPLSQKGLPFIACLINLLYYPKVSRSRFPDQVP
jgi:hypothetical protein